MQSPLHAHRLTSSRTSGGSEGASVGSSDVWLADVSNGVDETVTVVNVAVVVDMEVVVVVLVVSGVEVIVSVAVETTGLINQRSAHELDSSLLSLFMSVT